MDRCGFLNILAAGATQSPLVGIRLQPEPDTRPFRAEENRAHGRLGACAIDLRHERRIGQRQSERFPMASTFKLPLVMAVLSRADGGIERLDRKVAFAAHQIIAYSPVVARQPHGGSLTVAELCGAAIQHSDNTAANLLLAAIGGPTAVTAYLRGIGDPTSRLDRNEPALNRSTPGDLRDTTTPFAMARVLQRLVAEPVLSPSSKAQLFAWMRTATTGLARIRAGVPKGWTVGDKTGTTDTAGNDIAVLWPRSGAPIVLAVYVADVAASDSERDAAIAAVAHSAVRALRGATG
jgi:beta-lactamase class A